MRHALILCLTLAGCAPSAAQIAQQESRTVTDTQAIDRALARLTPGQPTSCLSGIDRRLARSRTIGSTVLFTVGPGRVFRNDMNGNCDLRRDPILITTTPTDSLCRGDIVQLVDRASRFPVGSCSYGDFVPYSRPK